MVMPKRSNRQATHRRRVWILVGMVGGQRAALPKRRYAKCNFASKRVYEEREFRHQGNNGNLNRKGRKEREAGKRGFSFFALFASFAV